MSIDVSALANIAPPSDEHAKDVIDWKYSVEASDVGINWWWLNGNHKWVYCLAPPPFTSNILCAIPVRRRPQPKFKVGDRVRLAGIDSDGRDDRIIALPYWEDGQWCYKTTIGTWDCEENFVLAPPAKVKVRAWLLVDDDGLQKLWFKLPVKIDGDWTKVYPWTGAKPSSPTSVIIVDVDAVADEIGEQE